MRNHFGAFGKRGLHQSAKQRDVPLRAFDAIALARPARSVAELDLILGKAFGDLGYEVFVGANIVDAKGRPNVEILFGQTHAGWEAHYQQHGYSQHDAVIREMLMSADVGFWSDIADRHSVTADERRVLDEAGDFGLKNGFTTPLHNSDGSISAVLLMGSHVDAADPDVHSASLMLSAFYGSVARRLRRSAREDALRLDLAHRLSARQLECLKWARDGKSSHDIAAILGISTHTVDEHLAAVCAKLGVRTRVQAVAEAVTYGVLTG